MRLIEHWTTVLWRSACNWVAMVLGAIVGALAHTYIAAFAILPFLPEALQLPLAILLGCVVIGGPIVLARLVEQPKMTAKIKDKTDEQSAE